MFLLFAYVTQSQVPVIYTAPVAHYCTPEHRHAFLCESHSADPFGYLDVTAKREPSLPKTTYTMPDVPTEVKLPAPSSVNEQNQRRWSFFPTAPSSLDLQLIATEYKGVRATCPEFFDESPVEGLRIANVSLPWNNHIYSRHEEDSSDDS